MIEAVVKWKLLSCKVVHFQVKQCFIHFELKSFYESFYESFLEALDALKVLPSELSYSQEVKH
jgi:hypothetical protein